MKLPGHIKKELVKGSTLLDVGCGPGFYSTKNYGSICSKMVTVDAWAKVNPMICADLEKESLCELVNNEKFDYVMMMDFIEHVDWELGERILREAQSLCKKRLYLLTPLEAIWNDNHHNVNNKNLWSYGNQFDVHKSLWHLDDFPDDKGWTRQIPFGHLKNYYFGFWEPK